MKLKSVLLGLILIEVATKRLVEGLQCYVCEDCNEYEDFKELSICGEIPAEVTQTNILGEGTTATGKSFKRTSVSPTSSSSSKPTEKSTIDDYANEDGDAGQNAQNSHQKNATRTDSTQTTTTSASASTSSVQLSTSKPTALTGTPTATTTNRYLYTNSMAEVTKPTTTTNQPPLATSSMTEVIKESSATTKSLASTVTVTTNNPATDYDDYLDYEDPLETGRSELKSLLKISEPVCYMIRYHANNTIITNRGCTTFVNASKYSTCQSLYNGATMESCRICTSNGCNKFLNADNNDNDNNYGILLNAAATLQYCSIFIPLLFVLFSRAIF